jgi:uncharacterized damage-inducible protein DinB
MPLGYLATLVATLPGWIDMMVTTDEFDVRPTGVTKPRAELATRRELLEALDSGIAKARAALSNTNDEHLQTPWRFMAGGQLVTEQPRHVFIRDAVFNHLAHHRGQLTVYLRLNDAAVPAIYGPSADEGRM